MTREFVAWPKISRFHSETMMITEKIDGTNAAIVITNDDIYAQSRKSLITPEKDNFGFAKWVADNSDTLREDLGEGRHFGEWWGLGIQRNYGLAHKRFSLFNAHRFAEAAPYFQTSSMYVVPILYAGPWEGATVDSVHYELTEHTGSMAAPGWTKPEGVVVYLRNAGVSYKITDAVQGEKHA